MTVQEQYQRWLTLFADNPALVEELTAIASDEKEVEDRFYTELEFGTAGMRGVMGYGLNRMNEYNVRLATQGLANYILQEAGQAERGVAIAYDSRNNSSAYAREAARVLAANGIKVYIYETLRPVPVLSYTIRHLHTIAGIVITASHNPKQYNGYKVYWEDGGQMPPERADEVLKEIRACDYPDIQIMDFEEAKKVGIVEWVSPSVDDAYIARVKALCVQPDLCRRVGKTLKIVYTPLNGSGNIPVRRILSEVGFENVYVVPEQEMPDGNFPTVGAAPNPENYPTFDLAREMADRVNADLVMATDPDSDRLGCLVRTGEDGYRVLTGNQIGCLLMSYILEGKKQTGNLPANGAVIRSIVSTSLADAIAKSYGMICVHVLTGFKFIAEKIARYEETGEHTFLFGFEESYGFLSGNFVRDKDAVIASMLLAECASFYYEKGMTLYEGLQEIYAKYGWYVEKNASITLYGKDGIAKMQQLMADLRKNPPKEIGGMAVEAVTDYLEDIPDFTHSNVLFYTLGDGHWACVRPSGTEPKIKVYVCTHAKDEKAADTQADRLLGDMQALLK